mgnify:CR=1 FL=1
MAVKIKVSTPFVVRGRTPNGGSRAVRMDVGEQTLQRVGTHFLQFRNVQIDIRSFQDAKDAKWVALEDTDGKALPFGKERPTAEEPKKEDKKAEAKAEPKKEPAPAKETTAKTESSIPPASQKKAEDTKKDSGGPAVS